MYVPQTSEKPKEEPKENPKKILVEFIKKNIKDVMISDNDPTKVYVRVDSDDHVEFFDLSGRRFLYWIKEQTYKMLKKVFSEDAYSAATALTYALSMRAPNIPHIHTYLRVAQTPEGIFYDLCNNKHEIVKITPGHVEILPMSKDFPVFTHSSRLAPQVTPDLKNHDGAIDIFVNMVSIIKKEKFLFKIHLISLFCEALPIPIIDLFSEQGKGKSQITASIKMIVDPQSEKLIENINKMPVKEENFHLECNAKYLLGWDNVSHISAAQSDDICRMITGGATEKRMLYSNDDLIVQYFRKKFTLNGIGVNITRGDYLDRSINYSLGHVSKNDRWTDDEYEEKLKKILPGILADIFVTISKAMKIYPTIKDSFPELPRMAGFAIWGEAISQSLGKEPGFFLEEFENLSSGTLTKAGENHPLVKYVEHVMQQQEIEAYNEPIGAFYNSMKAWAELEGYDIKSKYSNFPKSAQAIRSNLERVNGFIQELGYFVNISDPDYSRAKKNRGLVLVTISYFLAKSDNSSLPASQPATEGNIVARWQGGKDDYPNLGENSKKRLHNYRCNDCSTTWKDTLIPLDHIQTTHNENNKDHTIIEV